MGGMAVRNGTLGGRDCAARLRAVRAQPGRDGPGTRHGVDWREGAARARAGAPLPATVVAASRRYLAYRVATEQGPLFRSRSRVRMQPLRAVSCDGGRSSELTELTRCQGLERETGIEPATSSLGSSRSTAELLPRSVRRFYCTRAGSGGTGPTASCRSAMAPPGRRNQNPPPRTRH